VDLVPFASVHAAVVAGWPRSAEEAVMWCGEREFPFPAHRVADWQRDDDARAHLLMADDEPVGYGELWLDAQENEIELARIIIAPGARGKGLGRTLVRGLLSEAAQAGYSNILMRVHPANTVALRCYQGAGFVVADATRTQAWNTGQPFSYVWLCYDGAGPPG
jgi:ribosomal protein S18 acetylase RimI-like enzyme